MKRLRVLAPYSNYYDLGMCERDTDTREWRDDISKKTYCRDKSDK